MQCKIDHEAADALPKFLCVACNPRPTTSAPVCEAPDASEAHADQLARMEKRQLRKLRAERKVWLDRIALIGGRDPVALKKAEAALRDVERDLFMVA